MTDETMLNAMEAAVTPGAGAYGNLTNRITAAIDFYIADQLTNNDLPAAVAALRDAGLTRTADVIEGRLTAPHEDLAVRAAVLASVTHDEARRTLHSRVGKVWCDVFVYELGGRLAGSDVDLATEIQVGVSDVTGYQPSR